MAFVNAIPVFIASDPVWAQRFTEALDALLEIVMRHVKSNQCRAAELLGINRNTLRKKLKQYKLN